MIEINEKQAKALSRIGSRGTYGMAMLSLVEDNEKVYAISADLGGSSGLQRLMQSYPDRYINTGIAEQNMIGFAAGLAKEGLIPYTSSFAPFISLRCLDQIKMNLGYMQQNVKLVGLGSGFAMGELGISHYGLEDVAVLRAIPNIAIIEPADCSSIVKAVYASSEYSGPVYIRLTNTTNVPIVYADDFEFEIGKSIVVKEGNDVAIIATGSMVNVALRTAELLYEQGITCRVIDMHTIKPIDSTMLNELYIEKIPIISLEEHSVIGGLGSAIAEYYAMRGETTLLKIIGTPDAYGHTAEYSFQMQRYGLVPERIKEEVIKFIRK